MNKLLDFALAMLIFAMIGAVIAAVVIEAGK